jgi:putative PIN family toxin of toxin-antitoxin system
VGEKTEVARPRRVVLDTNVAVSALVFREGRLAWLREAWEAGRIVPIVSAETVAELVRVLAYPKLKLSEEETKDVLAHYMEHAEAVREAGASVRVPECRDPDDRKFLQLAYAAKADALVTGDEDLLTLAGKSRVPILAPDALKSKLQI